MRFHSRVVFVYLLMGLRIVISSLYLAPRPPQTQRHGKCLTRRETLTPGLPRLVRLETRVDVDATTFAAFSLFFVRSTQQTDALSKGHDPSYTVA